MRHVQRFWMVVCAAALPVFVVACGDGGGAAGEAAGEATGEVAPAPSIESLADVHLTLRSLDSAAVDLVDGAGETADGTRVTLFAAYEAQGDFDDDGRPETAVLVVAEPGGTGVFLNLVAFRAGPDGPIQVADRLLGDRQQIHDFAAESDSLMIEITTQGPGDPVCCPTRRARQIYRIRDGVWRLWSDNTLSAAPPDIHDGVVRRDSSLAQPGPVRGGALAD